MISEHAAGTAPPVAGLPAPEHGFGWLGAVVPAHATRFRVDDPSLRALLHEAGMDLAHAAPEVEIGSPPALHGDAELSIAVLGRPVHGARPLPLRSVRTEWPLPLRVLRRVALSVRLRASAAAAWHRVRGLGHEHVSVVYWDHQMALASTHGPGALRHRLVGLLPQRALVLGYSGSRPPTIVDAARAEAARATGLTLQDGPVAVRTGGLVADVGPGILRLGVGTGRAQILAQRRALAHLWKGNPPAVIVERVPWERAGATIGIAEWSLEPKLPGSPAARAVGGTVLADCLEFLVALHGVQPNAPRCTGPAEQADVIAAACGQARVPQIRAVAQWLEAELADVPRGYAHGDFFYGNLLVDSGRLCGVVDWEAAGPGRLPLLDLLHLRLTSLCDMADIDWGPLLARHLLHDGSIARDAAVQSYAERLGLGAGPERVRALAIAYWLDYASGQLRTHPHRLRQPRWVERNIVGVLAEITQGK